MMKLRVYLSIVIGQKCVMVTGLINLEAHYEIITPLNDSISIDKCDIPLSYFLSHVEHIRCTDPVWTLCLVWNWAHHTWS